MLYRKIETVIEEHLKSDSKKILLIDGARQVGKTYIIRYVGKTSSMVPVSCFCAPLSFTPAPRVVVAAS